MIVPFAAMQSPFAKNAAELLCRQRRPIHFQRFRNRRGLTQPDRSGSFWRLEFPAPVAGPLALGFACHYGLGLFKPDE